MSEFHITSAVLYRAGIGWFTATGNSTDQTLYFPVSTKDLDDFLKTSIISVSDGSGVKNLSFDTTSKTSLFDSSNAIIGVLTYLRGSLCEISHGDQHTTGKLLGFEQLDVDGEYLRVSILTENGIATIDGYTITEITPRNSTLRQNLEEFLASVVSDTDQSSQKMLRIGLNSEEEQEVSIQFLSEIPAWKVSYRLVLNSEGDDQLLIFGIVDNTTPVDFVDARLTLSTRLPVSFKYDLSTPHSVTRQEIERIKDTGVTVERKKASKSRLRTAAAPKAKPAAEPLMAEAAHDFERSPEPVQFTEQAEIEPSESVEFVLSKPVTIKKNETSMVPLTQETVSSEEKYYYNKNNHIRYPFKIVEFNNSLGYALDEGPVSIISQTTELPDYQGEAMIDRIPAGEDALILYALERDVAVRQQTTHTTKELSVDIKDYFYRVERRHFKTYIFEISNSTSNPLDLYLAIPKDSQYKLIDTSIEVKDSYDEYRIVHSIEANATTTTEYQLAYEDYQDTRLSNMDIKELDKILKEMDLDESEKKTITGILNYKQQKSQYKEKIKLLEKNLERLSTRRNQIISSLDVLEEGTSDQKVRESYVTDLTELDKKIHSMTEEVADLEDKLTTHSLSNYLD